MLVPVREYASAAEMRQNLMAIRNALRCCVPLRVFPQHPVKPCQPPPEIHPPPKPAAPKPWRDYFCMTADMATPPDMMPVVWRPHTVRDVLNVVCDVWRVGLVDLVSQRRTSNLIRPRHAAYALACKFTAKSLPEIGRHIGGRDHTTIISGRNKMAPFMLSVSRDLIPPLHLLNGQVLSKEKLMVRWRPIPSNRKLSAP